MGILDRFNYSKTMVKFLYHCVKTNFVDIDTKNFNEIQSLIMNFTWKWRDLLTLSNNNNVIQNGCLII